MDNLSSLLSNPASTALIGTLLGVVVTTIVNWQLKSKEAQLRILEKVFDKRLIAHENILTLTRTMNTTVHTERTNDEGLITYPQVIASKEALYDYVSLFHSLVSPSMPWLDINLKRELNFVQDYNSGLLMKFKNVPNEDFPEIATEIRSDLIDLADSLEKKTLQFFSTDINSMRMKSFKKWHKYKLKNTVSRLGETQLEKRSDLFDKY